MAKKIDISDKLNFEENPVIVVDGVELEVNADAETVLRMMGVFSGDDEVKAIAEAINLIFSEEDRKKLYAIRRDGRKLTLADFSVIIETAMDAIMGDAGEKG